MEVDVYRSLGSKRSEPLPGNTSFFQERLNTWRELCLAADWMEAASELTPISHTLPQILHHKSVILNILIARLRPEAALSLEPILDLIGALSRDLQADFLPHLDDVIRSLADLIDAGIDREPELLQLVFACLSQVIKQLSRQLSADLVPILKSTARLRHHSIDYVRVLAAQSLSYLLRQAPYVSAKSGLKALVAEAVTKPTLARVEGAGFLIAEAATGVSNGLHSRAVAILDILLQPDVLKSDDFKAGKLSSQTIMARVSSVMSACLSRLLEHLRRGKGEELWALILTHVRSRLECFLQSLEQANMQSAACGVAILSQMVEYHRGSRVERYDPIFSLLTGGRMPVLEALLDIDKDSMSSTLPVSLDTGGYVMPDNFLRHSLSEQLFRLLVALVRAHCKQVGASEGPVAIESIASKWSCTFKHPAPPALTLEFCRAMLRPPCGYDIAKTFGSQILGAIGRQLLGNATDNNRSGNDRIWPLLMDACQILSAGDGGIPLLLTAVGCGPALASYVRGILADGRNLEEAWAALQCLLHSGDAPQHISDCVEATLRVTSGRKSAKEVLVYCSALSMMRMPRVGQDLAVSCVDMALDVLLEHSSNYHAIAAAAKVLDEHVNGSMTSEHSEKSMAIISQLAPNLSGKTAALRKETLRCLFKLTNADVFKQLLSIEDRPFFGVDSGRYVAVTLGRVQTLLEYSKVPKDVFPATVHALLGVLYVKFSPIWAPAAEALGTALTVDSSVTWPLLFDALRGAQGELMCGNSSDESSGAAVAGDTHAAAMDLDSLKVRMDRALWAYNDETRPTDATVMMTFLLKSLGSANANAVESKSKEWVPLLLEFMSFRQRQDDTVKEIDELEELEEEEEECVENEEEIQEEINPARRMDKYAWRATLKEWLAVLARLKGARGLYKAEQLQQAVSIHILDIDPSVQAAALRCLSAFKLEYLTPYVDRLLRICDNKTLRAELASFPVAVHATVLREGEESLAVLPEHRAHLIPLLVRLLFPKMRKRSGRLAGKGAPGSARVAILNFLAACESSELCWLIELFLSPLSSAFKQKVYEMAPCNGSSSASWWTPFLDKAPGSYWLDVVNADALNKQPLRRRIGYLNTLEDLVKHLGHKLGMYLPVLMTLSLCLLEGSLTDEEGAKDVRSRTLRLLAEVMERFPSSCDYSFLWPRLFAATDFFVDRIPVESSADRAPALVDFAAALAAAEHLAPVLAQEFGQKLIGRCIEALGSPHCSEVCRSALLGLLENIFDLPDPMPAQLSDVHMTMLLSSLQHVVTAVFQHKSGAQKQKRKGLNRERRGAPRRATAHRALTLLESVGGRVRDWAAAVRLTDALLPLLKPSEKSRCKKGGRTDEELIVRTLKVLLALWSRLVSCSQSEVKEQLQTVAASIGSLFGSFDELESRLVLSTTFSALSQLLPELQQSAELLESLNATRGIDEPDYDQRIKGYSRLKSEFWASSSSLGIPALIHHCLRDLRNADDLALRHAGSQGLAHFISAAAAAQDGTNHELTALLQRIMFPYLKKGIGSPSLIVRQEHLSLLREAIVRIPAVHADLVPLTDSDQEVDFFMNVGHIQFHRRVRALVRLGKMMRENPNSLSLGTIVSVVLPLLQQIILEDKSTDTENQKQTDREANVTDAAVNALGAAAGVLPWSQYSQLLGQYLRAVKRLADGPSGKAVIRAVCIIVDSFHFDLECEDETSADILRFLKKRVVPELRNQIIRKEVARATVALAVVKVLKLLPEDVMRMELPRTLQKVANLLKERLQRIRDDSRSVLVSLAAELGPTYYPFIVEVVSSACPARGYTAHVLGYTVHATLQGVVKGPHWTPGALDDCLDLILPLMEADLFGDIAEAKEVDAFAAHYKEAKRCKAYDTYQLLASSVNFGSKASELLEPVRRRLVEASQPKVRTKLSGLLHAAARGILMNPTLTAEDLCMFFYAVVDVGLKAEEAAKGIADAQSGAATFEKSGEVEDSLKAALHQSLLVEFALTLLQGGMKKSIINLRAAESVELLDPLLPLLVRALDSRHSQSVSTALHALTTLIHRTSLPGLTQASPAAGKAVTELLKKCPRTGHPIAQDCFRLLAGMLRQCQTYQPPPSQLRFLLGWAFADLEESCDGVAAFDLLKAIMSRKIVLPEIYDLMIRIQELMIKSQSDNVRSLCSSIFLLFLLDYPLGEKRLQGHLQFLLTNLNYEHENGREAALYMLETMLKKFPEQLVEAWSEILFLPLVTRLVNDNSSTCRSKVGVLLGMLLKRVSPVKRDKLAKYCEKWLAGLDSRLQRAAAQTLGMLAEAEGSAFGRRVIQDFISLLTRVLEQSDAPDEDEWQSLYYVLLLIQKIHQFCPGELAWSPKTQSCWLAAQCLLLHQHSWVRSAAGRLMGSALADRNVGEAMLAYQGNGAAGSLALKFFRQIDSDTADEALAAQAIKCIVFLSSTMLGEDGDLLKSRNDDDDEDAVGDTADFVHLDQLVSLFGLCRRMSRLADDKSFGRQMQRGLALRFIGALSSRLGSKDILPYLPILLRPLYRITEPGAVVGNPPEVVTLAEEIMAHLRTLIGGDELLKAYNAAREEVLKNRAERKRKDVVQNLVDPEAAAKRRLRKQGRKAVGRKKKLEEVKRLRSVGVKVKNRK